MNVLTVVIWSEKQKPLKYVDSLGFFWQGGEGGGDEETEEKVKMKLKGIQPEVYCGWNRGVLCVTSWYGFQEESLLRQKEEEERRKEISNKFQVYVHVFCLFVRCSQREGKKFPTSFRYMFTCFVCL